MKKRTRHPHQPPWLPFLPSRPLFLLSRPLLFAGILTAALTLSACSGGGSQTSASMDMAYETAASAAGSMNRSAPMAAATEMAAAAEEAAYEADEVGGGLSYEGGALSGQETVLPSARKLIRTVDLSVETDAFDELMTKLQERITALGGYVEHLSASGRRMDYQNRELPRSAYLVARVPSDKLTGFVTSVEESGNVISKSESTQDVTLQYSDIESRKKSLTIEQERIWALLEKADTLEAVISLEERLSEIRYQLESMESQLRLYDNQVDYSTVSLDISEVTTFTPIAPESAATRIRNGFSRSTERVSTFLVDLAVDLAVSSPIWLPILLILLLILRLLSRRKRRAAKEEAIWRATLDAAPICGPEAEEAGDSERQSKEEDRS